MMFFGHGKSYSAKIFATDRHLRSASRSGVNPWINNDIRRKMNLRFLSCLRELLPLKIKKFMQDTRKVEIGLHLR